MGDKINTVHEPVEMLFLTSINFLQPGKFHDNSLICLRPVIFYVSRLQTPQRADTFVHKPENAKVSSHFAPWRKKMTQAVI